MEPIRDPQIVNRMKEAFELYQLAEDLMRQNLRRRHPGESEAEIERRLVEEWLRQPPIEHPVFVVRERGIEPPRQ